MCVFLFFFVYLERELVREKVREEEGERVGGLSLGSKFNRAPRPDRERGFKSHSQSLSFIFNYVFMYVFLYFLFDIIGSEN